MGNYVNSQHISGFLFTKYLLNYTIMLNICHLGRLLKLLTHLARRKLIEELQVRAKLLTPSRNLKVVVLFCYCLCSLIFTRDTLSPWQVSSVELGQKSEYVIYLLCTCVCVCAYYMLFCGAIPSQNHRPFFSAGILHHMWNKLPKSLSIAILIYLFTVDSIALLTFWPSSSSFFQH